MTTRPSSKTASAAARHHRDGASLKVFARHLLVIVPLLAVATGPVLAACPGSCDSGTCQYFGLNNVPVGLASLSIDPQCRLTIDGIGSSLQDGVVQNGLTSLYMATTLITPNLSGSIPGTTALIRQLGVVDGVSNQEIMVSRMWNLDGPNINHSVNCAALQVAGYTIRIYNGWNLVNTQVLGPNVPLFYYPLVDVPWMACGIFPSGDVYTSVQLGAPRPISFNFTGADPGPFTGDQIFIIANSPAKISTQQEAIENFFAVVGGTMKLTAMTAIPQDCPPSEISNLEVEIGSGTLLRFDSQEIATGPQASYEVVSGSLSSLRSSGGFSGAVCLGSFPDSPAVDSRSDPALGEGYYYLVRGRAICPTPGIGSYGDSGQVPDPRDALDLAGPC